MATTLFGRRAGCFRKQVVRLLATEDGVGYKGGSSRRRPPRYLRTSVGTDRAKEKEKEKVKGKGKGKDKGKEAVKVVTVPLPQEPAPIKPYKYTLKDVAKLDAVRNLTGEKTYKMRAKLARSLEKKPVRDIGDRARGTMDAIGDEIADIINESLRKDKFSTIFKRVKDLTPFVEIVKVVVNRDLSHADAYWVSPVIHKFAYSCRESLGEKREQDLLKKMSNKISDNLQKKEPQFRTEVMREMTFKRVPRIFFHKKKISKTEKDKARLNKDVRNIFKNLRGGEHGNGASLFEDDVDDDVDDYGPDDDLSTLSFSKRW